MDVKAGLRGVLFVLAMWTAAPGRGGDYYVATNGSGSPGIDWASAFTNIQDALTAATASGDRIFLAGHTFMITNTLNWTVSGITIRGGYEGTGSPGSNDPARWRTLLKIGGLNNNIRALQMTGLTSGTLEQVTVTGGASSWAGTQGGGISLLNSTATIASCILQGNTITALEGGAGLKAVGGSVVVTNCTISGNTSAYSWGAAGGGVYFRNCTRAVLAGCVISNNYAYGNNAGTLSLGGGIYGNNSAVEVADCTFAGNHLYRPGSSGGAVYMTGGSLGLSGCLMTSNWVEGAGFGGGLFLSGGTHVLRNCTIIGNPGDGIVCTNAPAVTLRDSIVRENGDDLVNFATTESGALAGVTYCNIEDGDNNGINGCLSADPLFVNKGGQDYHVLAYGGHWTASGWVQDDTNSPCVDAGDPASDYTREPQPNGGRVNMGCYGNTAQASRSLPEGLAVSALPASFPGAGAVTLNGKLWGTGGGGNPDVIFCWGPADGGTSGTGAWEYARSIGPVGPAGAPFSLDIGDLAGGTQYVFRCYATNDTGDTWSLYAFGFMAPATLYVATNGSGVGGASWATAFTNIQDALDASTGGGDVIYLAGQVFMLTNSLSWTRSGVTMRGGYEGIGAPGNQNPETWPTLITRPFPSTPKYRILSLSNVSNAVIENVTVANGETTGNLNNYNYAGGGIWALNSRLTIRSCVIINNIANQNEGGGIYLTNCTALITNCTVAGNRSATSYGGRGGGISISGGTVDIRDCIIRGNGAEHANTGFLVSAGGGINVNSGTVGIRNCLVFSNSVYTGSGLTNQFGAGIHAGGGAVTIDNCTIVTNRGDSYQHAGVIAHEGVRYGGGVVTVKNSIIRDHQDDLAGFPTNAAGVLTGVSFCNIGNGDNNGVNGCMASDPLFGEDPFYHLKSRIQRYAGGYFTGGSWTNDRVNSPCIDAGDPASDYSREPLPNGRRVDMGAYGNSAVASKSWRGQGSVITVH